MGTNGEAEGAADRLAAWVREHLPDVPVVSASVARAEEGEGVRLRLLGVTPRAVPRASDRLTSTLRLDYLLTVRLPDPEAEACAVVELAFAAMDAPGLELLADRPAPAACAALGLPPAPGLVLRLEETRTRELPRAPLVREPAVTRFRTLPLTEA